MKKILLLLIVSIFAFANEIGVLEFKKGLVKVQHKGSIKKQSLKVGEVIYKGDKISTYKSLAVIRLNDNSTIKLDNHSTIKFLDKIVQENGRALYKITKRKHKILHIATTFTNIGVKGTTFVVDTDKDKMVALKKGLISLTSLKGKYEIHKKKLVDEFEAFKSGMDTQFGEYKQSLYKEFIEYKKSFDLEQNKMVSFNGNKVYEKKLDKKIFNYFDTKFK